MIGVQAMYIACNDTSVSDTFSKIKDPRYNRYVLYFNNNNLTVHQQNKLHSSLINQYFLSGKHKLIGGKFSTSLQWTQRGRTTPARC